MVLIAARPPLAAVGSSTGSLPARVTGHTRRNQSHNAINALAAMARAPAPSGARSSKPRSMEQRSHEQQQQSEQLEQVVEDAPEELQPVSISSGSSGSSRSTLSGSNSSSGSSGSKCASTAGAPTTTIDAFGTETSGVSATKGGASNPDRPCVEQDRGASQGVHGSEGKAGSGGPVHTAPQDPELPMPAPSPTASSSKAPNDESPGQSPQQLQSDPSAGNLSEVQGASSGLGAGLGTLGGVDLGSDPGQEVPPLPRAPGPNGPSLLPPLRLDFLNWPQLPGESGSGSSASSRPLPPRGPGGAARRRRSGATTEGRSRSDRILQLVLAAKTLLQVRAAISRHLNDMSASTASVALSRLAGLSVATMRLRRAQQEQQPFLQGQTTPQSESPSQPPYLPAATRQQQQGTQQDQPGRAREKEQRRAAVEARAQSNSVDGSISGAGGGASCSDGRSAVIDSGHADGSGAGNGTADVDTDADVDPSARVQQGSLRLMRLLLRRIAICIDTGASYSGATAAGRWRGGAGTASSLTARSGSRPLPSIRSRATSSSSSSSWRFQPPEHRARLAGSVLATLARVGLKPGPGDLWALYRLVEAARPDLFLASPQQLSRLASSLPLLPPLRPSPTWLDHFASVSRSKMYAADPGHLAAYVWCLARLGHNPGDLWLHSLTQHLNRDGNLRAATPGQLCQVLWALHRLEFSPDPDWRTDCMAAVQAALTTSDPAFASRRQFRSPGAITSASGRKGSRRYDKVDERDSEEDDLCDSSSSVDELVPDLEAVLGPRIGNGTGGFTAAAARRYGSCYADLASLLLWAVRMGMAPGLAEMELCLERLQPALRSLRRVHLLRLILALSEADHRPSEAFMGRLLACLQPKLPLLGPSQLTQLLMAVSRLRFVPPQSWLVAFLKASRTQLRHYTPALATATYQVFAGWQLRPSRPYLQSLHSLLDSLMPEFPAQGLATVLQSMAALGIKPQHRWLARALEVLTGAAARSVTGPSHGSLLGMDAAPASPLAPSSVFTTTPGTHVQAQTQAQGGYLSGSRPLPPLTASAGYGGAAAAPGPQERQQQQQSLRQQQRAAVAAALVTAVCSLRGIVQFDGERALRTSAATTSAAVAVAAASKASAGSEAAAEDAMLRHGVDPGNGSSNGRDSGSDAEVTAALADGTALLLPYELWSSTKQLTDLCQELLDVMSGSELAKLLTVLARINFYPGRAFLAAHARATARVGAQLSPADKEALAACYSRLAVLAPQMAEEARRQAEARQARTAVVVADPWVD